MDPPICQECKDVFHNHFDIIQVLGQGSFGVVFQTRRKRDGAQFAVKRLDLDADTLPQAAREVNAIVGIGRHPTYIVFEELFWHEHHTEPAGHLYISMELCERLTLREWLKENNYAFSRPWVLMKDWIMQLAGALDHLHNNCYIHRDLKPANVFFQRDTHFKKLKVGDFGLATRAIDCLRGRGEGDDDSDDHTAGAGTPYYMAPEQSGKVYDEKVDIFALGLICAELIIINSPTLDICTNDIIRSGQWPIAWMDYPDALQFLSQLTHLNPKERPTASQVLHHSFLQ